VFPSGDGFQSSFLLFLGNGMVYKLEKSQACVKTGLSDHPEPPVHPDQQNIKTKKEWPITVIAC